MIFTDMDIIVSVLFAVKWFSASCVGHMVIAGDNDEWNFKWKLGPISGNLYGLQVLTISRLCFQVFQLDININNDVFKVLWFWGALCHVT